MRSITIAGNIGKDAETRRTQNGDPVTSFSVATEERVKQEKRTIWFDVSLWGKRGESLCQYLTKGSRITVTGDLSTHEHEGRTYLKVRAYDVTLQGGKQDGNGPGFRDAGHRAGYDAQKPPADSYGGGGGYGSGMDDDLPFMREDRA